MSQPPLPPHDSAPVAPPAPVPKPESHRLSTRTWVAIVGGAVALILVVVLGSRLGDEPDPSAGPTAAPVESPAPEGAPDPSADAPPAPGEEAGAGETISLDEPAAFAAGPFWVTAFAPEWEIELFDAQGFNRFHHTASDCTFLSFQGSGRGGMAGGSDRAATESSLKAGLDIGLPYERLDAEPAVRPSADEVRVLGGGSVEVIRLTAAYSSDSEARERVTLMRAFLPAEALLMAQVDCPAGALERIGAPVLDELALTDV